ncbi:hypothetical protein MRB53_042061 [Persea americana]|nr:hypothetical protein MRB53_042061 [Persea americana]
MSHSVQRKHLIAHEARLAKNLDIRFRTETLGQDGNPRCDSFETHACPGLATRFVDVHAVQAFGALRANEVDHSLYHALGESATHDSWGCVQMEQTFQSSKTWAASSALTWQRGLRWMCDGSLIVVMTVVAACSGAMVKEIRFASTQAPAPFSRRMML